MPNEILVKAGTSITWTSSGGDYGLTCTSLADDAAREGAKGDLGSTRARRYHVYFEIKPTSAPTAGELIDLYWSSSSSATAATSNTGDADGTDSAFQASIADVDVRVRNLTFIGALSVTDDATAQSTEFVFEPGQRYGMPIVINRSGVAFSATGTDHKVVLTPIVDEVQ